MQSRVDKLRNLLNDDEAVIISGYPNIFYYSGFTSSDAYLIISHNRQILVTDSRYTLQAKEQTENFEIHDIKSGLENIFKTLTETRIGYEEDKMTVAEYKKIWRKLAPYQDYIRIQKTVDAPRRVKDADEIKKIAEA